MSILPVNLSPENLQVELTRLWHREAFFDATQRLARFGYCEWDYVNDCLKSCTGEYAQIFLMSIDEVIASQDSWEKVLLQLHPDDRQLYTDSYRQNLGAGSHEVEYRILRKDGQVRHIKEIGVVVYDEAGEITGSVGLLQDLTERKEREQELEYRDAMVQKIETITDSGYFIWDLVTEKYIYISPGFAGIHGLTVEEYLQRHNSVEGGVALVYEADYDERLEECRLRSTGKIEDFQAEFRIVRADGEIRWVREQGMVVGNVDSNSNHEIGILQDITEQKCTEQSLREARDTLEALVDDRTQELAHTINQLKTEMVERDKVSSQLETQNAELERYTYTVSHDLKTPLVTIKGFVALLGKDIAANDAVRIAEDFEKINNAADTMDRLLSDLLELSRIGRVMGDPVSCNLNDIAAQAIDMVRSESHAQGVKITTDILPQVIGDATRLHEVFQNLLENAVKFMGDQPEPVVHVGTLDRGGEVCCYVRDNGVGIDGNYHEHIFGLFERLNASIDGTGVGLALVKRIIEVHGGKIWVESDGLNQGCSFYFTLPG